MVGMIGGMIGVVSGVVDSICIVPAWHAEGTLVSPVFLEAVLRTWANLSKDLVTVCSRLGRASKVFTNFMDLDSPEDDPIIVVDESEGDDEVDKDEGIHSTSNFETEDASASKPSSPRSIQLQGKNSLLPVLVSYTP
ncbi:hypothetical protein Tco_0893575 [Tanacetum coccineum]|uniref:Uncharacterized protein n=1 Tax=Tanacetum coccineum TaxID=301880 RepID=A0ABQ5CCB6_9ASTR